MKNAAVTIKLPDSRLPLDIDQVVVMYSPFLLIAPWQSILLVSNPLLWGRF